eukprot:scaffold16951_cov48-Attheya_sp.AAC.2
MKQNGGHEPHEQAREQPKSAPAMRALEQKDLDHGCGIHAIVKGQHNFRSQSHGIRNPFQVIVANVDIMLFRESHKLVERDIIQMNEPVEAKGGTHGQYDDDAHDHLSGTRKDVVAQACIPVEGTQVLDKQHQLTSLNRIPLCRGTPPQQIGGQNGQQDGRAAIGAIFK